MKIFIDFLNDKSTRKKNILSSLHPLQMFLKKLANICIRKRVTQIYSYGKFLKQPVKCKTQNNYVHKDLKFNLAYPNSFYTLNRFFYRAISIAPQKRML